MGKKPTSPSILLFLSLKKNPFFLYSHNKIMTQAFYVSNIMFYEMMQILNNDSFLFLLLKKLIFTEFMI